MVMVNMFRLAVEDKFLRVPRFLMHIPLGTQIDASFFVIPEMVNLRFLGYPFHPLLQNWLFYKHIIVCITWVLRLL